MKILENIQISVSMTDRFDITDKYSMKCDFILNTDIFIDAALIFRYENVENVMFYDFIIWPRGSEWDQRYDQP